MVVPFHLDPQIVGRGAREGRGPELPRPQARPSQGAFALPPGPRADTTVVTGILRGAPRPPSREPLGAWNPHIRNLRRRASSSPVTQTRQEDLGGLYVPYSHTA